MAKNKPTDWSATPASNTDIGGIAIQGASAVSNFDNAFRQMMAQWADVFAGTDALPDTLTIGDPTDLTKRFRIDVGSVTTATTRVMTLPDQNITITAAGAAILDDADAAAQRTTLGVKTGVQGFLAEQADGSITPRTLTDGAGITITNGAGSGTPTIALSNIGAGRFLARLTASGDGAPEQITGSQALTEIGALPKPGASDFSHFLTASDTALVLPAGGSWMWVYFGYNTSTGALNGSVSSGHATAGGTTIASAVVGTGYFGFWLKVA